MWYSEVLVLHSLRGTILRNSQTLTAPPSPSPLATRPSVLRGSIQHSAHWLNAKFSSDPLSLANLTLFQLSSAQPAQLGLKFSSFPPSPVQCNPDLPRPAQPSPARLVLSLVLFGCVMADAPRERLILI
ncbi:hypothetical protein E2C01_092733 [Portunus trituberculatus]|uniref:Uncharacterized protein n=1 Tax=Portunus trituberculatus TaxID=210409 RepID=A0A5B7JWP3_PORTR|nr:hypothetical protein [Portunus trituberculatus]